MRKIPACLALIAMLMSCFAAQAQALTLTDDMGREVRFDRLPETCVSLTPANTEILFALGLQDRILGVDNQSDYPPEALSIENKLGDYFAPNIEAIVALRPDVVFASDKLQREAVERLEGLGLTVVCNDPTSLDGVIPGIEAVARIMNADAGAVTVEIEAIQNRIAASAGDDTKLKVYFALSFGEYGNYTAGPGTFIDEIISLCGGVNVAGNMPVPWPEYSMEQLILDDPDLIIVSDYMGDGSLEAALGSTPGFDSLRCVREGRVFGINADITSRPGPRIGEAMTEFERVMRSAGDSAGE